MSFSTERIDLLNEDLIQDDVKEREGTGGTTLSYLASFHVIAEANRIFGFDGWDTEILSLTQADKTQYEKPAWKGKGDPKPMVSISYLCKLRVTVKADGATVVKEDVGFGNGVAGDTAYGLGSCIELASKEAVTDALKRCMRYYGNKFGLTLYDKDTVTLPTLTEVEKAKPPTEIQLTALRDLYIAREIDDAWVMTAMKAEGYMGETIESMTQDWYELAISTTHSFKLKEVKAATYEADITNVIRLMKESANMNMLKALFKEAWEKTTAQGDKEKQGDCQKLYEKMKKGFENE